MDKSSTFQEEKKTAAQDAADFVAAAAEVLENTQETAEFPVDFERLAGELKEKLAASEDNWLRAKAETENIRRRAQEDVSKAHKFAIEKFAGDLLAVKDSLEAALASPEQSADDLRGGVELTLKQLVAAFEKSGLKEISPLGEKFDPHRHQAIQMVASDLEVNTVAQVLQKGYLIAERVLRPAIVLISKGQDA
ncbi:MAG: nucleotide exchange factor GrpE [Zoogloeaceae bacterium]|jgi:molecular chaperone GrpE|nr:nucleotide exchange factor GrpE [Zoogloeaceae bacterium]